MAIATHEPAIEAHGAAGAARRNATDAAIIAHQFGQDPARQDPFRAICDEDIGRPVRCTRPSQIGPQLRQNVTHLRCCANRRGGFQNDQIAGLQHRRNLACGIQNMANIGSMICRERGWNGDQEGIGRFNLCRGAQKAPVHHGLNQPIQIRFLNMDPPGIDRFDHIGIDIDTDHLPARPRDQCGGRQADIAQPQNNRLALPFSPHWQSRPQCARRPCHRHMDYGRGPWRHRPHHHPKGAQRRQ